MSKIRTRAGQKQADRSRADAESDRRRQKQTEADRSRQKQTEAEQKIDAMQLLVSDISGPSTTRYSLLEERLGHVANSSSALRT